jgi:hypothetical protein
MGSKPKCPNCGALDVRYRVTDDTLHCRTCGTRWPKAKRRKAAK